MQTVSCPGCGAQVAFRSHASVLAVCEYCKATVAKDADAVKNLGRMADVLEDYTRIQIGTSGVFGGRPFGVVGRIQLRYSAGIWNEWYVLFEDGGTGWLGDSSGLYTLTMERPVAGASGVQVQGAAPIAGASLPAFEHLRIEGVYNIAGQNFSVSEIRTAQCIAGQGELPFVVGAGWQAKVADMRAGGSFLTLDYSDGHPPHVYVGSAVTLDELRCQLLRDDDTVLQAAGKVRGKVTPLSCPSCGSGINYVPGVTAHLVCPACQSQVVATGATAVVLEAATKAEQIRPTLSLGMVATINGSMYQLIGFMLRSDDEGTQWTEYLAYSAKAGFLWIVETDEGWSRAKVVDEWPVYKGGGAATMEKVEYAKLYDYEATVDYVAGAFNWAVKAGDKVAVSEFEHGSSKLAREATESEVTWSKSVAVPADQIHAWFGNKLAAKKTAPAADPNKRINTYLMWLLGLNIIPMLLSFGTSWVPFLIGVAAIYLPAKFLASNDKDKV